MWDALGLPRETNVPGQSWNPNGISTFFHRLNFSDFPTLDAILWRTGGLDRQMGEHRDRFVDQVDEQIQVETYEDRDRRANILARYSDQKSLWYQLARSQGMRDHMILAFETTRTREVDSLQPLDRNDLANLSRSLGSDWPAVGNLELASLAVNKVSIPAVEAVLGRPYYELTEGNLTDREFKAIDQSVEAITDDIVSDALVVMGLLHVRPYAYWASETELMIAAARPGKESGPWTRQEVEKTAPMLEFIPDEAGNRTTFPESNLRDWSNMVRDMYEPRTDREVIRSEDAPLIEMMSTYNPELRTLLESEAHTSDEREMIKRLVRLARFGYGNSYAYRGWIYDYRARAITRINGL